MQSTYSNILDLQPAFYLEENFATGVFQGIAQGGFFLRLVDLIKSKTKSFCFEEVISM